MPNPLFGDATSELLQNGDGSAADTIYGDLGNDTIIGLAEADMLAGEGGQDRVFGGDGADSLDGGNERDRLWGGNGDDSIEAGAGNDDIYGGRGNDTILGNEGADLIYGGKGHDRFIIFDFDATGSDSVFGGAGNDAAVFYPVQGGHFDGGTGQDTLALFWPNGIFGNIGDVLIDMRNPVGTAASTGSAGGNDAAMTFTGVEVLVADLDAGNDTVFALDGNDDVYLYEGANQADMGGGDDHVSYLVGSANVLEGGTGQDTLFADSCGCDPFTFDASGPAASDSFGSVITGFEQFEVIGSYYADTIILGAGDDFARGSSDNDTISGGGGADHLAGDRGADEIDGGDGNDVIRGGNHDDTIYGGADDDRLSGNQGADVLDGGTGADTLVSGMGDDTLYGGDGSDTFRYNLLPESGASGDLIADFASGEDRLEFAQTLLSGTPATGQVTAADFAIGAAADNHAQFVYIDDAGTGLLYWDADGSDAGAAQLLVRLDGLPPLVAGDIFIT